MAFKLRPPYIIDNTHIHYQNDDPNVLGRANDCGSINVNIKVKGTKMEDTVISHEKVHLDQMKRGDLSYDGQYIYWKGKRYKRGVKDGSKSYPWEKEAYKKEKK
jgi:hypothetical protein